MKKNRMLNSIEGSRKIKETYRALYFLFTHRLNDVVVNSEKSRLSGMICWCRQIDMIEEIICREMSSKTVFNNTLSKFR